MTDLVVLVPSRGRPDAVRRLLDEFQRTITADTNLQVIVDADDPQAYQYPDWVTIRHPPGGGMVAALNWGFELITQGSHLPFAVGFMGDDHRPRTRGWDTQYLDTLHELGTGIVYGNDLFQKSRLPTQCAMTTDIPRALGKMAPRELRHMYVDNWWRDLGTGADCLRYLPDVVIEHMHPIANKSEWDEGYRRVNADDTVVQDRNAYRLYQRRQLIIDTEAVKNLRLVRGT